MIKKYLKRRVHLQKKDRKLYNTPNQPSKFKTKIWGEINDDARGTYN